MNGTTLLQRIVTAPYRFEVEEAAWLKEAHERGHDAGKAAGSWVIDGNTSTETCARILAGLEDGDPEVLDALPSLNLGEWAGESESELVGDLQYEDPTCLHESEHNEQVTTTYMDAWNDGMLAEVTRAASYQVS